MIAADTLAAIVKRLRRDAILPPGSGSAVSLGRADLERLLPHRAPMLLVDHVDAVDLDRGAVRGSRRLHKDDFGFAGHFEDAPVYPGVLTIEALGQLALTLLHFVGAQTIAVPPETTPARVRATHIHHATFVAPLVPGDHVTLHAEMIESGLTMIAAGQAYKNDTLAAFAISEVYVES